jgi:hypothetical protein
MEALYCYSGSPAVVKGCAKRRIIGWFAILAGEMSVARKLFPKNEGSFGRKLPILLPRNTLAMFKSIARNPYISLLTTAWKYAREERWRYLVVYGMFMANNLIEACLPIAWGWFINEIQQKGVDVFKSLWLYVGAYLVLHFSGWAFHFLPGLWNEALRLI